MHVCSHYVFRGDAVAGATRSDRRFAIGPLHCRAARQSKFDLPTGDSSGCRPVSSKAPRAAEPELPAARRAGRATTVAGRDSDQCAAGAATAAATGLAVFVATAAGLAVGFSISNGVAHTIAAAATG